MQCSQDDHTLGARRLEFVSDDHGEIVWRCLDCGETIIQYQDHQGC